MIVLPWPTGPRSIAKGIISPAIFFVNPNRAASQSECYYISMLMSYRVVRPVSIVILSLYVILRRGEGSQV